MPRLSLAQQIAQLEDTAPPELDPEDIRDGIEGKSIDSDSGDVDETLSRGREHYVEVGPSELRKMADNIAHPKYDGVKTSRDRLLAYESDDEAGQEERWSEESPDAVDATRPPPSESGSEADQVKISIPPLQNRNTAVSRSEIPASQVQAAAESQPDHSLALSLRDTRAADRLKGKAVSRQLGIWDSLVDARIRLQKSVIAANRLPPPGSIASYVSSIPGRAAMHAVLSEAIRLSDELYELRHTLLTQQDANLPLRKKRRMESESEDHDYEALIGECTSEMVTFDALTHSATLSNLQKWSSKVQAVAPLALLSSSRATFRGPVRMKNAAELVDEALLDPDKAAKRTWGTSTRVGGTKRPQLEDADDEEVFDDRDFYQSMLRDVIETKGGKDGMNAADFYPNYKKQKKIVDTKASKGRKLRYEPHEKLQHFMMPVPMRGAWHEEQIDELFASLLGNGFEEAVARADNHPGLVTDANVLEGFRVFG